MLNNLVIKDFVIVEHLTLEFAAGFTVLSGETGAGKSILIDALLLVLGARSDASLIREGAQKADICASFDATQDLKTWLEQNELLAEDEHVLLRRVIDQQGRSKAFINGTPVTTAQLKTVAEHLLHIHGQHAHQQLLQLSAQRNLLDQHAQLEGLQQQTAACYSSWQALLKQQLLWQENSEKREQYRQQLLWQFEELEKLNPQADEWEPLSQEHHRLSHAAELLETAQLSLTRLEENTDDRNPSILLQVTQLAQMLDKKAHIDSRLQPIAEMLESSRVQLQESAYVLQDYLQQTELDPNHLQKLEDRLQAYHQISRKLRLEPSELYAKYLALTQELQQFNEQEDPQLLQEKIQQEEKAYGCVAKELSEKRQVAAKDLSLAVSQAMQTLNMVGGSFVVQLQTVEPSRYGIDQIEFFVSGHAGSSPRPLHKVASGGELARIALAISVITANANPVPSLIFDEVDSGVGGAVAEVVGKLLKNLGKQRQVFCITHLPQVAAQAEHHFQVKKTSQTNEQGQTLTHSKVVLLSEQERIQEIARMLGGIKLSSATIDHAKAMLDESHKTSLEI